MGVYLFPISNKISKINFQNTIVNNIDFNKIRKIYNIESNFRAWGLKNGVSNRKTWNNLKFGDLAIFVEKDYVTITSVKNKIYSEEISKIIWPSEQSWEYIFFVEYISSIKVNKKYFLTSIGYSDKDRLMGNRRITDKYIDNFYSLNYTNKIISSEPKVTKEVEYTEQLIKRIKRDQNIVRQIKERHNWKCQACSFTFMKEDGSFYVEAAHINQLSISHDDSIDNLLALCANCHKMLDLGCVDIKNNILKKCGLNEVI